MRIQSISSYQIKSNNYIKHKKVNQNYTYTQSQNDTVSFTSKHTFAKGFAGVFGTAGTLAAIGGMLIMTGGLGAAALPFIAGYGAVSAGIGASIGHQLDKVDKDDEDNNNKDNK